MNSKDNRTGTSSCKMNNYKWNRYKKNKQLHSTKERKKNIHRSTAKAFETEEEATIRRFHDAQRMARFRARKRKALEEVKTLKTGNFHELKKIIIFKNINSIANAPTNAQFQSNFCTDNPPVFAHSSCQQNKYSQLLTIIQDLGKDIKLSYAGSKISAERVKIGIVKARILIKECLLETEMTS
nr:PREDICTED: uncharacterized protein LOC105664004 [Megachile rotundata]